MTNSIDDLQLATLAVQGDANALRCLLLRHHDALLRTIRAGFPASLKSVADEEDVLQVTLAEIAERIVDFEPRTSSGVGAWLRKTAERNLTDLIRFHRAAKRGGQSRRVEHPLPATGEREAWLEFVFQHSLTPSRAVAAEEALAALQLAMEQLPEEYQSVIRLRYLEERSIAETAGALQRSEAAVRGLSYRAMVRLKQIMGRYSHYFSRS